MKKIIAKFIICFLVLAQAIVFSPGMALAVGTNGGFEIGITEVSPGFNPLTAGDTTSITDWSVDTGGVDYIGSYWQASQGTRSVDLNGLEPGSISQILTTVIGTTYDVTFDLSGNPENLTDSPYTSPNPKAVRISATGAVSKDFIFDTSIEGNTKTDMMWESQTYSFTATAISTTLTFASQIAGAFGPAIDNVLMTEKLPESPTQDQICTSIDLTSGTETQFYKLTTADPLGSSNESLFTEGTPGAAVVAGPTGFPGAWDAAAADSDVTGASWVNNSATQPTNPAGSESGLDGTVNTWRLFSHSFTIPAEATTISSPVLHFTADNSVEAYLDDVSEGTAPSYATVVDTAPLTLTAGTHTFKFVVKNDAYDGANNPTGLLYKAMIDYCVPNMPVPTSSTVHIFKYIDGEQATAQNASGVSFPMFTSTYNAPFTLSPGGWTTGDIDYEASTAPMPIGSSYSANENLDTNLVGASCDGGAHQYSLVGYSVGNTLIEAEQAELSLTIPSFTDLQGDKYIIVRNHLCPPIQTVKVHILKYLDEVEADIVSAGGYQFPMTATWQTSNLNGGVSASGNYVLGNNHGGASDQYGADTSPMNVPADYTTSEITDSTSQVVSSIEQCAPGKYLLNGYKTSMVSFDDAATQILTPAAPVFIGLQDNQYVIVYNSKCPTTGSLTIQKNTIGGNGAFNFTGDLGNFQITTTGDCKSGTGSSQTFTNLQPGIYHISETSLPKWTMTDNDCAAVEVVAGEDAICIVTNTNNKLLGEIRGSKLEDKNGDGKLDHGFNRRLSGWTIYIDSNANGSLDSSEPSTVTDKHGAYRFSGLVAGTYIVREVGQDGWIQTAPAGGSYTINLKKGQIAKNKNFGNFKLGTISGMKYNDLNGNGRKDNGEVGLAGWTINLKGPGINGPIVSTVTDTNGNYSFTGLKAGTYTLSEVMQVATPAWRQTDHPSKIKVQSGMVYAKAYFGNTTKEEPNHHFNPGGFFPFFPHRQKIKQKTPRIFTGCFLNSPNI